MDATEAALRAAIWAEPEDREALSVYADWLLEHGEATRGEYMQLALLPKPTPAQRKRRDALLKKHRGAWLGPARPFLYTWEESETSPGFLARAKCAAKKLAAGFEQIRALGPRLVVEVNAIPSSRDRATAEAPSRWIPGTQCSMRFRRSKRSASPPTNRTTTATSNY